jgi:hypothetical protein
VKLNLEEGEAPCNEREVGAHRSGLGSGRWQMGDGAAGSDRG